MGRTSLLLPPDAQNPSYVIGKYVGSANMERKCADTTAGSLRWPFPVLKYDYIFELNYTEAIVSNSTRKLLWFETTKMLIAV